MAEVIINDTILNYHTKKIIPCLGGGDIEY